MRRAAPTAASIAAALVAALTACSSNPKPITPPPPDDGAKQPATKEAVTDAELVDAKVAAVEIRGNKRIGESRARLAIALSPGMPFDRTRIRDSLRQLMTIRGIADARAVAFRTGDGGVGVAFVIIESPAVSKVAVSGNQSVSTSDVLATANIAVGAPLDPVLAQKGALAIKERYQGIGHFRAEVDWKLAGDVVTYSVREGPRASITKIEFPGARAINAARLNNMLLKASAENTVGGAYVRSKIEAAMPHITAAYYDIGHVEVVVGPIAVNTPAPDKIEVAIPIAEGVQYRLGALSVKGVPPKVQRAYRRQLKLRTGSVFSRTAIGEAIKRLAAYHQKVTKGPEPAVTPLTDVDKEKRRIDIAFDIE